jgi:hypothetical protein
MTYTIYDLDASLERAGIERDAIKQVIAAWGISGDYSEWDGGFLMELKDGRFAYLTGWCDTTGWGCQDGVDVTYYQSLPDQSTLKQSEWKPSTEWDSVPTDLDRYVRGEIGKFD